MFLPSFLTTSVLALTASAFLIPLEVADDAKVAALANTIVPSSQTINLDCSTCPLAVADAKTGRHAWIESGPKTNLEMTFSTSEDRETLTLNGAVFWPPTVNNLIHPLKTKQVVKPDEVVASDMTPYSGELALSYSLEAQPEKVEGGMQLIPVVLQVLGLDGKMINVDPIVIPIIRNPNSAQLALAEVKTTPAVRAPGEDQCTTIICRIRAIIIAKFQAARLAAYKAMEKINGAKSGCMRKMGFKIPAHAPAYGKGPKVHGGPDKFRGKVPGKDGHRHEHEHHHMHGMARVWAVIKRMSKHVVLPVLIGIAAGMAVSAAGMVIGQLLVMVWMRYRRAGRGSYAVVEQVEEDGLPKYEDVGAAEEDATDEKKELLG